MPVEILGVNLLDVPVTIPGQAPGAVVHSEGKVYLYGKTAQGLAVSLTATLSVAGNVLSVATSAVRPYVAQSEASAPAGTYIWFRQADLKVHIITTGSVEITAQHMTGPIT